MKFEEVVQDIKKLVGIKLRSIRPGADITLTDVNPSEGRLELIDASQKSRSRSISELRRVWNELSLHKAVHVDSVLAGSGSSRNQPETILASLPYVEWLLINGRKHISFIGRATHALGTLKQMDNVAAQALRDATRAANAPIPSAIIIVENTRLISSCLELISGLSPTAIASGVYRHAQGEREIWIVNGPNLSPAQPNGVYVVLSSKNIPLGSGLIQIADMPFHLIIRDGVNILFNVS
jgi:hypothetical protein